MTILRNTFAAILLTIPFVGARAQAHPLVGRWSMELAVGMRMENGEHTPVMGTGILVLAAQGDSLVGTLAIAPPEGQPARPPARMAAKLVDGDVIFVVRGQSRINQNGEESVVETITTWKLSAKGEALAGSLERQLVGFEDANGGPLPVKGTRVKA